MATFIQSGKSVRQRGASIVEFAIIIPVLLLFLALIFESGRLFYTYLRFTGASWEGARFFSSLKDPAIMCAGDATTNLAFWEEGHTFGSAEEARVFQSHKVVHERVRTLFLVRPESWSIRSDLPIPDGTGRVLSDIADHMPTIVTEYIGQWDSAESVAACEPDPSPERSHTVTVCLYAVYQGIFFNIPVHSCSTSYLLEDNQAISIVD